MQIKKYLVVLALSSLPATLNADIAIIANSSVDIGEISTKEVSKIFLGKIKHLSDGTKIKLYDLPDDDQDKWSFYKTVTRKNSSQLNSYWARKLFTGQAEAPIVLSDASHVLRTVSSNQNAIGYVNTEDLDDSVKVLHIVTQ